MPTVMPFQAQLVAVGYGIKKLAISAHIVDDLVSVDDIQEAIQQIEEYVQSTDIASFSKL
jgi:elongation factor 1-beta